MTVCSGLPYKYPEQENQDSDYLIKNNIDIQGSPHPKKAYPVYRKLQETMLLLHPLEEGFSKSHILELKDIIKLSGQFDNLFADEIAALYYFHLYYDHDFRTRISKPANYYSSLDPNQLSRFSRPKSCLSSIIQNDKKKPLLGEWFYRWIQDIGSLQKEIYYALISNG
jgi:hypothetical protein